jgi:hypothetical protein
VSEAHTEIGCINTNRYVPDGEGVIRESIADLHFRHRFELRIAGWRIAERRNSSDWQGYFQKG